MTGEEFIGHVKRLVAEHTNAHPELVDEECSDAMKRMTVQPENVYIVWSCKTLQNWKAIASTPRLDGLFYEVTYNGDKNEIYLDAYKKIENRKVPLYTAQ